MTAATSRKPRQPKAKLEARLKTQLETIVNLRGQVRAKYDAAQTNDENRKHWVWADALSARAAMDPGTRRILRMRARYEVANSPLADSMLTKLADYVVGTGPALRLLTDSREFNRDVEAKFAAHAIKVKLSRKLWLMRYEKAQNGEAFAVMINNLPIDSAVKLDLRMVEADQVANPNFQGETAGNSDGVIFDDFGNPIVYEVLRSHPGETFNLSGINEADQFPAERILHYYREKRSGQTRGVPEITAALPYFAMRRKYILAVLGAAEIAADLAGVLQTTSPVEDPTLLEPFDTTEIERKMFMALPEGYALNQLKAEQPTSTIDMFDAVVTREIGRCLNMPYNIAAGDNRGNSFSGGKIDLMPFDRSIRIEQDTIEDVVADPFFAAWFNEATLIPGYLNANTREVPPHQWVWDGRELLDPREAGAQDTGLRNGSETHARVFAKRGLDAEAEWETQAKLLGMSLDEYRATVRRSMFSASAAAVPTQQVVDENGDVIDVDGQPASAGSPASIDPKAQANIELSDIYATAVRAGLLTPNIDDEIDFRKRIGLPPVNDDVRKAWATNGGSRQPITLKSAELIDQEAKQ